MRSSPASTRVLATLIASWPLTKPRLEKNPPLFWGGASSIPLKNPPPPPSLLFTTTLSSTTGAGCLTHLRSLRYCFRLARRSSFRASLRSFLALAGLAPAVAMAAVSTVGNVAVGFSHKIPPNTVLKYYT